MERIIIRPMYITDPGYRKGMKVAILESTGEIIKKHFDNVGLHIPKEMRDKYPVVSLSYDEIDWSLANPPKKTPEEKELEKRVEKSEFTLELLNFLNNYQHKNYELTTHDKLSVMAKIISDELKNN
jgi:hypothetical protein